eukprot:gene13359-biopygen1849
MARDSSVSRKTASRRCKPRVADFCVRSLQTSDFSDRPPLLQAHGDWHDNNPNSAPFAGWGRKVAEGIRQAPAGAGICVNLGVWTCFLSSVTAGAWGQGPAAPHEARGEARDSEGDPEGGADLPRGRDPTPRWADPPVTRPRASSSVRVVSPGGGGDRGP